jgi:NADH-quinone oxidoreductase subunit M
MILLWLIVILLVGGVAAWAAAHWSAAAARWIGLGTTALDFALTLAIWVRDYSQASVFAQQHWIQELNWKWFPAFGIHFHLAMDGLSLLLVVLTSLLGMVGVLASWSEIQEAVGFFHLNLLWVLAGIVGVFLAMDLFLFYFAWELMLIPMYFLIAIWGHEHRVYAALKFFLFTQLSSLLMLVSILALYFLHQRATGAYTFEYADLLGTSMPVGTSIWVMLGFFVAFAVKLPMVPLHTWLPDAHTEAPTAGSVVLAGLLLKTGAYGLLRFVVPLFPEAAKWFAPIAMTLAAVGIIYGAVLAFAQTDLKRLVAYTSVSHLGFVLLGVFVWNKLALEGALITILAHGISTGTLFVLVGALQERTHTREIGEMGGLWQTVPRFSGAGMFFVMASIGLPGLGDFVGEFLILLGTYKVSVGLTVAAAIGVFASTLYGLKFVQGALHGTNVHGWRLHDLFARETAIVAPMIAILLWLGLYPQPVLNTFSSTMDRLQQSASQPIQAMTVKPR